MPERDRLLSGAEIMAALHALARRLSRDGQRAEIYVHGGACMVLVFNTRLTTRDVDAVFEPESAVQTAAWEVAQEQGLPRYWLNQQASTYLSRLEDRRRQLLLDEPGLRVYTMSAEFLLAMKIRAGRRLDDEADIRDLAARLGITSTEDALALQASVFPDDQVVKPHARALLEDIFGDAPRA